MGQLHLSKQCRPRSDSETAPKGTTLFVMPSVFWKYYCFVKPDCSHLRQLEYLTLLHSEQPKLYGVLAALSATGLKCPNSLKHLHYSFSFSEFWQFMSSQMNDS